MRQLNVTELTQVSGGAVVYHLLPGKKKPQIPSPTLDGEEPSCGCTQFSPGPVHVFALIEDYSDLENSSEGLHGSLTVEAGEQSDNLVSSA